MKLNKLNWILIGSQVLLIVVIIMISKSCENNRLDAELNQYKLDEYLEERQTFITEINEKGDSLTIQKQVLLSKDKKIEKQLLENSNLKKLNSQIKIKSETAITNLIAEYEGKLEDNFIVMHDTIHDTIPIVKPIGVKFGTEFASSDPWYNTSGIITDKGVKFDSIAFKNDLTITVGKKREKWHKPMETYVEVKNNNPYTTITGLNNVTIKKNKEKIWSKPWFNLTVGILGGFIIGAVTTK